MCIRDRSGVAFESPSKAEKIVIATAPSLAKLPSVKQGAGVSQNGSQQVVACGVTGYLFSYATSLPGHYLADLDLSLAAHHVLGIKATLTSTSELKTVLEFVNSVSFPFPECVGVPPTTTTTSPSKAPPVSYTHLGRGEQRTAGAGTAQARPDRQVDQRRPARTGRRRADRPAGGGSCLLYTS